MVTTLGSLATRILEDTNRDPSGLISSSNSDTYTTAVYRAINSAILYCEPVFFWLFKKTGSITVLEDSISADLPDDYLAMISVIMLYSGNYYSEQQGFIELPYDQLIAMYNTPDEAGVPIRFAQFVNKFFIYPMVEGDTEFILNYYYKDVTYPSVADDISIWFNDMTVDLIRLYAMYRFYLDTLQAPEMASAYLSDFSMLEKKMQQRNAQKSIYYTLRS